MNEELVKQILKVKYLIDELVNEGFFDPKFEVALRNYSTLVLMLAEQLHEYNSDTALITLVDVALVQPVKERG